MDSGALRIRSEENLMFGCFCSRELILRNRSRMDSGEIGQIYL